MSSPSPEGRSLDVGCGKKKRPGSVGLDCVPGTDADLLCDLGRFPWPLRSDSFTTIWCWDVLEHLPNTVRVMEELHRIGRPGARIHINTPHFASIQSWEDPTHVKHFAASSFDYFCEGTHHVSHYTTCKFRMVSTEIYFGGRRPRLSRWIARHFRAFYERYLCFVLRPRSIRVVLEVLK